MEFEWDDAKDAANRAKHGLALAEAARMDWAAPTALDARRDYGEPRWVLYGAIDGVAHVCTFTLRGGRTRITSLRRANRRERRRHGWG